MSDTSEEELAVAGDSVAKRRLAFENVDLTPPKAPRTFKPESPDVCSVASSPVAAVPVASASSREFFDSHKLEYVRLTGSTEQRSPLVEGPSGFCVAHFGSDTVATDVPNLALQAASAETSSL